MKKRKSIIHIILIILGSALVAFTIYNIHSKVGIAEGGQLGFELLMYNWFNISPAIVSLVIDISSYLIGYLLFGKIFLFNVIIGTVSYSVFYFIFEQFPPIIPNLTNYLLIASILGGVLVGIGCGIVVGLGAACGGDDSIVIIISKITKIPISISYFILDFAIILLSLTYIEFNQIIYSLITALISSSIIGYVSQLKIIKIIKVN